MERKILRSEKIAHLQKLNFSHLSKAITDKFTINFVIVYKLQVSKKVRSETGIFFTVGLIND